MAKNYSELQGVMEILREVFKLPRRNKKIFFFIILSTIISYSVLFVANIYSLISRINNISTDVFALFSIEPNSPDYLTQFFKIDNDLMLFMVIEMIFMLLMTLVSLAYMVATIYVSAMSYLGKDLTIKDLFLKLRKIWFRPVITWFYIFLLNAGYLILTVPLLFLLYMFFFARPSIVVYMVGSVFILLSIFISLYLSLLWVVSLVTSVLEDFYGLKVLGLAEKLVQGRKSVGFVLSFMFMILLNAPTVVSMVIRSRSPTVKFLVAYVAFMFIILVKILSMMVYTMYYFDCKQSHGEEVEVEENIRYTEYSKLPTVQFVESALP